MRSLVLLALLVASTAPAQTHKHALPFVPSADSAQQGFVRIVNRTGRAGTVRVYATDDTGERFGPFVFNLVANQARGFNSRDLEDAVGDGEGHWWLELHTELDILALGYVRTFDGFVTSMHDVVERAAGEDCRAWSGNRFAYVYRIPFFNPASNLSIRSVLRIVNPNGTGRGLLIKAQDSAGSPGVQEAQAYQIDSHAALSLTSQDLERDYFGDGTGKWQLWVCASRPLWVMNLLQTRAGPITNLSSSPPQLVVEQQPEPLPEGMPPKPTGLKVGCGIGWCLVSWHNPFLAYDNHKSTWIYRNTVNDFSTAERVGTHRAIMYVDDGLQSNTTYYYWIRWESTEGILGPRAP